VVDGAGRHSYDRLCSTGKITKHEIVRTLMQAESK